jgi:hypothetical protein
MDQPARPWYQTLSLALAAAATGFLLLGNILGAVGNAFAFVSPLVTYVGTAALLLILVGAHLLLLRRALPWRKHGRIIRVTGLRMGSLVVLIGMIALLWIPRLFNLRVSAPISVLQLAVINPKAPRLLIANPLDVPVTNARVSFTLWNVDIDPSLLKSQAIVVPSDERAVAKIEMSEEVPWVPRHTYLPLAPIEFTKYSIRPGDRVMGWVSISCMNCVGSETVLLYLVAGKEARYAHIASKNAPSEEGVDKVLKCLTCPISSFLSGPSDLPAVQWISVN